jgi:acyl-CoA thioesterase-2
MTDQDWIMPPDEPPATLIARLVQLMDLEPIEENLFRGACTQEPWRRVFGGQVIGQALMAACHTVDPARAPHSLHAYFMRAGDPALPIVYQVSRDRDGGSFSSRRVVAIQHGQPILNLAASFQGAEPGLQHQTPMPDVPPPEGLQSDREAMKRFVDRIQPDRRDFVLRQRPIEFRPIEPDAKLSGGAHAAAQMHWFRAIDTLPDDPRLHRVLLAYASDMTLLATSLLPHGLHWFTDTLQEASLDHALWIHDDLRLDQWLLYVQDSPWTGGARGLSRGQVFTREGKLVASVAQEGLMRVRAAKT